MRADRQPSHDIAPDQVVFRRWGPGPIRRLVRRRSLYWSVAALLPVSTGAAVASTTADARRLRDGYGATATVLVTTTALAPGDPLTAATELRTIPLVAVPDAAVASLDGAERAARPVSAGAVLTSFDVAGSAAIGRDEAAVAVPVDPTTPSAAAGAPVLVVVHADPLAAVDGTVVDGRVLARDDERVTVVVPLADLTRVSAAIARGGVGLALSGG